MNWVGKPEASSIWSSVKEFEPVLAAADSMSGFAFEWFVAGGWAIDLFLRAPSRPHHDLDLAIDRDHQADIRRHLQGWSYEKVVPRPDRSVREAWGDGEWLDLPIHEVHARSPTGDELEFLFLERHGDEWVYRRDPRITLTWERVGFSSLLGVRALAPEVVLLFKSTAHSDRDQRDFESVLPRLSVSQQDWLRNALRIAHPRHQWLSAFV